MGTGMNMRIAEIALRVGDLDRASRFYADVLGFAEHLRLPEVVFLTVGPLDSPLGDVGHPQLLALFGRGQEIAPETSTFDHIAFEVPPDSYDAERQRIGALVEVIRERSWPEDLPWRGRSFFFRDPDGNVVEIIAALPEGAEAAAGDG